MGIVERLFGRSAPAAPPTAPPAHAAPSFAPYLSDTSALGLSAVWRCIQLIADSISDLPWREWRGPEISPSELEPSRLVRRPMATMTRREWTWRVVATEALYSTAYLLHVGGFDSEGVPWSLLPVPPLAILPITPSDPWGLTQPTRYVVGGAEVGIEDLTIIRRAPFPGVSDEAAGILNLARREFGAYLAADYHAAQYWTNGGPTQTVITTEQELDDTQAAAIGQRWVDRRSMGSAYPAVLGKGASAEAYGADPTTESAVEARREIVADIGRYFGVPTRILNAPAGDSETYSNVEQDAVNLERYTLRGYMGPVEDAISELLPGDYIGGRRMRFDVVALTAGDLASRAVAYPALVAAGILTKDEARARGFGLGPMAPGAPAQQTPALPAGVAVMTEPAMPAPMIGGPANG